MCTVLCCTVWLEVHVCYQWLYNPSKWLPSNEPSKWLPSSNPSTCHAYQITNLSSTKPAHSSKLHMHPSYCVCHLQFCHCCSVFLRPHVPTRKVMHIARMPVITSKHSTHTDGNAYMPCHIDRFISFLYIKDAFIIAATRVATCLCCGDPVHCSSQTCIHRYVESETVNPLHRGPPSPPQGCSTFWYA